jgi:hypothetical protein
MSTAEFKAKISRRAKRLRAFVIALMVVLPVADALLWLRPAWAHVELHGHATAIEPTIAVTGATLVLEIALFELARMLTLVASGEYFSVRVIQHFRSFAGWLLFLALLGFFGSMIRHSVSGGIGIEIGINFDYLLAVGLTLLLFLLARLLERAGEIEQENREIV